MKGSIDWVKGVGSKWGWDDPFVMWFVDMLIDGWSVFPTVNEILE